MGSYISLPGTIAEGEPREMRLDAHKCEKYFDPLTSAGKLYVCGMCLYACPHGRK